MFMIPFYQRISTLIENVICSIEETEIRKIQTQKGSNEHLFLLILQHSMHIFGEIPFVKPQNDT